MQAITGDLLIFSGEGDVGNWEHYHGSRTVRAIRSRLTKERAHGDRWATLWVSLPETDGVYGQLDAGLVEIVSERRVPDSVILDHNLTRC
jgi:hypothetical protein